jgi:CTP synthase
MRLGAYTAEVIPGTLAYEIYKNKQISERHRHRYEVNNTYLAEMVKAGLVVGAVNKELNLVEMIELKNHPWFVACQFHPEMKSRINKAHPIFREFVRAARKYHNQKAENARSQS